MSLLHPVIGSLYRLRVLNFPSALFCHTMDTITGIFFPEMQWKIYQGYSQGPEKLGDFKAIRLQPKVVLKSIAKLI